jgi:capsular exopolysaccharide synthesis family protein
VEFRGYLRAVTKRWVQVAVVVVLAVALAGAYTFTATPKYASSITFFVTTPASADGAAAYSGGLFSQQRVKSYANLLQGRQLSSAVIADLGLDMSSGQLQAEISPSVIPESVLLQATVVDPSAERAQQIASSLGTKFAELVSSLETPPGSRTPTVKVEVVEPPALSTRPVSPHPLRDLLAAAVVGLLLGAAIALVRETLDTTIKSLEGLHRLVEVANLGLIPYDGDARKSPLLVYERTQRSARSEAFRQLRTNLQFVDVDQPPRVIAVTSSLPHEGKSTVAANLAVILAEAGTRTLFVEGDLRRPRVVKYLGLEGAVGLTDVLVGRAELSDVLQQWGSERLSVLASGAIPPNPSELLGSHHMTTLLAYLETRFDVVLIDAPPLLPVADGAILAAKADGALLVVRHGATTRAHTEAAMRVLQTVDARLLGTVLNMVPAKGPDSYSYGYAYAYADTPSGRPRLPDGAATDVRPPAPSAPQPRSGAST